MGVSFVFCVVVGKSCMNSYVVRISGKSGERKGDGRLEMKMVSERQEKADREKKSKNQKFLKLIFCSIRLL